MIKDSEILKRVKTLILSRQERWICLGIDNVYYDEYCKGIPGGIREREIGRAKSVQDALRLQRWILDMLDGCETFEEWLRKNGASELTCYASGGGNYETRILVAGQLAIHRGLWLDQLIAICEREEAENEQRRKKL